MLEHEKPPVAFLTRQEVVIGPETEKILASLYPHIHPEDITTLYPERISQFKFVEPQEKPSPRIAVLGFPGIFLVKDSFMLQEAPLADFGVFTECCYPKKNLNLELYFSQIADLIDRQKVLGYKVVLLGESMGGTLAAHFLSQSQEVDGLILIGSPLTPDFINKGIILTFYRMMKGSRALEEATLKLLTRYRAFKKAPPSTLPPEFQARYEQANTVDPQAFHTRGTSFISSLDHLHRLSQGRQITTTPTLFLVSQKDRLVKMPDPEALSLLLPNHIIQEIDAPHSSVIEYHQNYNPPIINWLKEQFLVKSNHESLSPAAS